jgi:hypothetical protein
VTVADVLKDHAHVVKDWRLNMLGHQTQAVIDIVDTAPKDQRDELSQAIYDADDRGYWQKHCGPQTGNRWIMVLKKDKK